MKAVENAVSTLDEPHDCNRRIAARSRILMRSKLRVRGSDHEYPILIKDVSSTGLRASTEVSFFAGSRIEVEIRGVGWVAGEIVRAARPGQTGIKFAALIRPELLHQPVSGSYSTPGAPRSYLRRV